MTTLRSIPALRKPVALCVWSVIACVLLSFAALAKEVIPPAPKNHFNDYAGVVSPATATQLNNELVQFERDTGNQFIVAIYPKMQSDSSIEDYTVRVARAWKVGTKEKNNGVVLFIFTQDHKMFIQTGYGLEGALPDALCKRIVSDEIAPHFKQGDFNGGVTAGVHSIVAATKGEYRGTGYTVKEGQGGRNGWSRPVAWGVILFIFVVIFMMAPLLGRIGFLNSGGYYYSGGGGGWSGGGGFGGGGGSFSGGGGSFGGGGAGGSW